MPPQPAPNRPRVFQPRSSCPPAGPAPPGKPLLSSRSQLLSQSSRISPTTEPPQRPLPSNPHTTTNTTQPAPSGLPRQPPTYTPLSPAHQTILHRHGLSNPTVTTLLALPHAAPPDEILAAASHATELSSFPLRPAEKALFSHLNATASFTTSGSSSGLGSRIPWPLSVSRPTQTWEKAFLFAQTHASGDEGWIYAPPRIHKPARSALLADRRHMVRVLVKVLRCAADLAGLRKDGVGVRRAMEAARSVAAGVWESGDEAHRGPGGSRRPGHHAGKTLCDARELLQVPEVGEKKMEAFVKARICSVRELLEAEFWLVERVMKRNPPFGMELLEKMKEFPRLGMRARVERWATTEDMESVAKVKMVGDENAVQAASSPGSSINPVAAGKKAAIVRAHVWVDNADVPNWRGRTPWVSLAAERGPMPKDRRVLAYKRGQGQEQQQRDTGQGNLLFFWRGSTKRLLIGDGGMTLVFAADLAPGEEVFLWTSCEEVVGTLVERVITAPKYWTEGV